MEDGEYTRKGPTGREGRLIGFHIWIQKMRGLFSVFFRGGAGGVDCMYIYMEFFHGFEFIF